VIVDNFVTAPTVGSHDENITLCDLMLKINHIAERMEKQNEESKTEQSEYTLKTKKLKWRKVWKKVKEIFKVIIAPILVFLPRIFNAIARKKGFRYA
jgi:esterase/lipase